MNYEQLRNAIELEIKLLSRTADRFAKLSEKPAAASDSVDCLVKNMVSIALKDAANDLEKILNGNFEHLNTVREQINRTMYYSYDTGAYEVTVDMIDCPHWKCRST